MFYSKLLNDSESFIFENGTGHFGLDTMYNKPHKHTFDKPASGGPKKLPAIWPKCSPPSQLSILIITSTHTQPVTLAVLVQPAFYPCLFRCTWGHNGGALAAFGLSAAVISLWLPHASYLTLNSLCGIRANNGIYPVWRAPCTLPFLLSHINMWECACL